MTDANLFDQGNRTLRPGPFRSKPVRILSAWFERFVERHAPVGYQDKTGCHFGIEPVSNESAAHCLLQVEEDRCVTGRQPRLKPEPNQIGCQAGF
jgi:hypothetical protein